MLPADLTEENIRAAAIAHAIRLGRCPEVGWVLGFNFELVTADSSILETGDLSQIKPVTEKVPYEFKVTTDDIKRAIALLEAEKVTYPFPKLSVMALDPPPLS